MRRSYRCEHEDAGHESRCSSRRELSSRPAQPLQPEFESVRAEWASVGSPGSDRLNPDTRVQTFTRLCSFVSIFWERNGAGAAQEWRIVEQRVNSNVIGLLKDKKSNKNLSRVYYRGVPLGKEQSFPSASTKRCSFEVKPRVLISL